MLTVRKSTLIPLSDMSTEDRQQLRAVSIETLAQRAINKGIGTDKDLVVRDGVFGDPAAGVGPVDLQCLTALVAGERFWVQNPADFAAADTLAAFTAVGPRLPNNVCWCFYGFWDHSGVFDLDYIVFNRGTSTLAAWEPEQCYTDFFEPGGMTRQPVIYEPTDPISVNLRFQAAAIPLGRNVGFNFLVCETKDNVVSAVE